MTLSMHDAPITEPTAARTGRPNCVADVMTAPATTIRPSNTYIELVDVMLRRDVGGLPVVDAAGMLVGIVTVADLIAAEELTPQDGRHFGGLVHTLLGRDAGWMLRVPDRVTADVMTHQVVTVTPETSLTQATALMRRSGHHRLPVVQGGVVVGVVAGSDLVAADTEQDS